MPKDHPHIDEVFEEAIRRAPGMARAQYLDEACGDDDDSKQRVGRLLRAFADAGSFLESPAAEPTPTVDQPALEKLGSQIGPYKLLQEIGQGGMGVVYMAEQHEPVRRKVALKIIKPGMDTRQVIARFEAERQALSLMDHPNIARVLDAGMTDSGRPYFVMELVKGQQITQYCDEKHLTPRQRLELLLPVCQAIQHAHQKGIIHRDIKPSNILVAEYDQQPVPKVIDFGVAKATSQPLTDKTMFTGLGQIVGTLEYMSPEQAKVNQLDIDTRSDIYSLGVLLYELLTGSTPFDKQRLRSAAWDEMLRIIREEEPPKPSTRLSDSKDSLASVSAQRHTEPARLMKLVRGELDWIVMKALEKDRTRRYETAVELGNDIQRYLNDEPVVACRPSAVYKFRKFARRNRLAFVATAAIGLSLIIGTGVSIWQAARATRQRDRAILAEEKAATAADNARTETAIAKAVNDFLQQDLLGFADTTKLYQDGVLPDPNIKMRTILDRAADKIDGRFANQPVVEAQVRGAIGMSYMSLGQYAKAEDQYRSALGLSEKVLGLEHPFTVASMSKVAAIYFLQGRYDEAEKLLHQMQEIGQRTWAAEHPDKLAIMYGLAAVYVRQGRGEEAERLFSQLLERERLALGNEHPDVLTTMGGLALAYRKQGRYDEAEAILRQTLEIQRETLGAEHPDTLTTMFNLVAVCCDQSRHDEAKDLAGETLAIFRRTLGDEHPTSLASMHNLAVIHLKMRRYDESEKQFRQVLELRRLTLGDAHPDTLETRNGLAAACYGQGYVLYNQGELVGAIACFRAAIEKNPQLAAAYESLGTVLASQDKLVEATLHFRKVIELDPMSARAHYNLGCALLQQETLDDALACFERAVQLDPQAANAHWQTGCALLLKGKKDDAVTAFRQALKLGPDDATILSDIVWRLTTDPDLSVRLSVEAVAYAQKAVELKPDDANQWSNLGIARLRAGDWRGAVAALEKSDGMVQEGDLTHRMFFAMAQWQLGNQQRARELFFEGVAWMEANGKNTPAERRFREEASQLLGIQNSPSANKPEPSSRQP